MKLIINSRCIQISILKTLPEIYPSVVPGSKIYLTFPVKILSAERSFSKSAIIKNYLRPCIAKHDCHFQLYQLQMKLLKV